MITVISYPNNTINESFAETESLNSNELVKYIWVDVEDAEDEEYIEVSNGVDTITLLITEECRYEPIDIFYFNKNGQQATFTMFKKSVDSLSFKDETFDSDSGQPLNGIHQTNRYNVQVNQSLSVNTGFIDESNNEIIKQILISEKVWRYKDGIFTPLIVKSKTLEYKTQANDKLINYTLQFDYAFNEINSI